MQIFKDLEQNIGLFEKKLPIQKSFDLVGRRLIIAGKPAYYLLVDGLSKDDVLLRLFQHIQGQQGIEDMETLESFLQNQIGYIETTLERDVDHTPDRRFRSSHSAGYADLPRSKSSRT